MIVVRANDYGRPIPFIVYNPPDSSHTANWIKDLTGYTVHLKVWPPGNPAGLFVNGLCVLDIPANGTCHYTPVIADFTTPGTFQAELELTKTGDIESTLSTTLIVQESA